MDTMQAPKSFMGHPVIECLHGTLTPIAKGGATEQRGDMGAIFYTTVTVDPANMTTITAVDTAVTVTGILTTDKVVVIPPATLEAGLSVYGTHTVIAGGFSVRVSNPSNSTINPASATWGVLVFRA